MHSASGPCAGPGRSAPCRAELDHDSNAVGGHPLTLSRQRTVPVTCFTRFSRIAAARTRACLHVGDERHDGVVHRRWRALRPSRLRPAASARMERADTASSMARWAPRALAISTARSTAAFEPDTTTWPGALSLAAWQRRPARPRGDLGGCLVVQAQQRRHRAGADGVAFCMASPRMLSRRAVSARRRCRQRPAPSIRRASGRRRSPRDPLR